jgi:uncharacterized protein YvpB
MLGVPRSDRRRPPRSNGPRARPDMRLANQYTPALRGTSAGLTAGLTTGLTTGLTALLLLGLAAIGVAIGFILGQRLSSARSSDLQADTSALLLSVDATRTAQQFEIAQLRADLEKARQDLEIRPFPLSPSDQETGSESGPAVRPPWALILDAPLYKQERSLSCESSAAAMAAGFYGLSVSESDILSALPRHEDPNLGFRGNVDGPYGGIDDYGTYAEPIRQVLSGVGLTAGHLEGGIEEIKQHIRAGRPVIAWVTYRLQVQTPRQVTLSNGTAVTMVPYQHVVLVVGYNASGLWVHDPYDGTRTWYGEDDFRRSFAYLGNMALVVGPPVAQR